MDYFRFLKNPNIFSRSKIKIKKFRLALFSPYLAELNLNLI